MTRGDVEGEESRTVVSQFGPYQVQGLIARGGMGEILRAYDTRHDRVVALKLLAEHLTHDQEFRERFRREAHAAARLNEPHVIPIHSYGEIDGRLYLDMRLVEGNDVASLLAQNGAMPPGYAVGLIEQVAQALDAAHAEGLVHRDVKPSNILVTSSGFAYLVDFGIAHSPRAGSTLTSTGYAVGTMDYMAPERFDDAPSDRRSDVYSLACVLYQCLTGAKPFHGETPASLINAHLHQQPPRPSVARGDLPQPLDQVIARGLAKDPAQRFASAGELARVARMALTSPIPRMAPPAKKTSTGARWGFALGGAAVVAALLTTGVLFLQPRSGGFSAPQTSSSETTPPAQDSAQPPPTSTTAPASRTSESAQPPPSSLPPRPPESEPPPPPEESAPPPEESSPPGGDTRTCSTLSYEGAERGIGCFEAVGDHLFAQDTEADGMWIKVRSETDYGREDSCEDRGSEGDMVDCNFDMSEKGQVRFRVELWDGGSKVTDGPWTEFVSIGQ